MPTTYYQCFNKVRTKGSYHLNNVMLVQPDTPMSFQLYLEKVARISENKLRKE